MVGWAWLDDPSPTLTAYDIGIYRLGQHAWVACPLCERAARVTEERGSCTWCGWSTAVLQSRPRIHGRAVDPFLHRPLWLQTEVRGETLWAYNAVHLAFLELHVREPIRTRAGLRRPNNSLGSRLPKWMTAAKARDDVLKGIARLERRLEQTVSSKSIRRRHVGRSGNNPSL